MCVCCIHIAGIISTGDEDEAEGPVEKANGEVQGRGGARLWRSGQVRRHSRRRAWYMEHIHFGSVNHFLHSGLPPSGGAKAHT